MKIKIIILGLMLCIAVLSSCRDSPAQTDPLRKEKPSLEQQAKIDQLQTDLEKQSLVTKRWQTVALSLGAGCFVLLILGTALGSKTRHDASSLKP